LLFVALAGLAFAVPARAQQPGERIAIQLRDGSGARLERGELVASGADLRALTRLLRERGVRAGSLSRTFSRDAGVLRAERERAERRSGRRLADLSLFFDVPVPHGTSAAALADALRALPEVESAQPWPRPMPAPVDLAPPTPDFSGAQSYTAPAPAGIGSAALAGVPGADGAGTRYVDVEYEWLLDHEDLELDASVSLPTGTPVNPFPDQGSHGNAVLGILSARANGYGVTGLVPAAQVRVAASYTEERFWDVGHAIERALEVSSPGDLILIEQQICVCNNSCGSASQFGAGPVEWFPPWRAVIANATALGVIVVEAAGNGAADLDAPSCDGVFDRALSDTGAVIVAAGSTGSHAPLSFSTYGSRVDVQGIGEALTTLGGGALFDPGDPRQRYQSNFGGSSGASAMVAGVLLSVQGLRIAAGLAKLEPRVARELLVQTGTPQAADARLIGPLPDLEAAYAAGLAPPIPVLTRPVAVGLALLLFAVVARRVSRPGAR
jgi:hypothetical protein